MSGFDVLVVDDEAVVIESARRVLEREGLTVDAVEDAEAALIKLSDANYGVVLVDLMLPRVSGLELLETVAAERPDTPAIMTTGYATAQKTVSAFKAGVLELLPKPFEADELLAVIRRGLAFGRQSSPRESMASRIDRFAGERRSAGSAAPVHSLGAHSWARIEADGLATIGVAESFPDEDGASLRARLPDVGDETLQGCELGRIYGLGEFALRVWAPLSGRVADCNPRLESDGGVIGRDRFGKGWLTRIMPTNLEEDLSELKVR